MSWEENKIINPIIARGALGAYGPVHPSSVLSYGSAMPWSASCSPWHDGDREGATPVGQDHVGIEPTSHDIPGKGGTAEPHRGTSGVPRDISRSAANSGAHSVSSDGIGALLRAVSRAIPADALGKAVCMASLHNDFVSEEALFPISFPRLLNEFAS